MWAQSIYSKSPYLFFTDTRGNSSGRSAPSDPPDRSHPAAPPRAHLPHPPQLIGLPRGEAAAVLPALHSSPSSSALPSPDPPPRRCSRSRRWRPAPSEQLGPRIPWSGARNQAGWLHSAQRLPSSTRDLVRAPGCFLPLFSVGEFALGGRWWMRSG